MTVRSRKYRRRIYEYYVAAWEHSKMPQTLASLESRGPTMRYIIRTFFPNDKAGNILDLGCGHGTLVYFAHLAGYVNAHGVDASAQQVELANKLNINNIFFGDLMAALEAAPRESLDAVVAFDVIEHFNKDELVDLVDGVLRALKPTGCWIIHAPNANSPFAGAIRYGDYTHELALTPTSLHQLLKASGFSHVVFAECGPRVHGLKSLVRGVLWEFVRTLFNLINAVETGTFEGRAAIWTRNFYAVAYKNRPNPTRD